MKVVVDTNIVFSAILGNTGTIGDLLLNSGGVFEFCTCELLRVELRAHQERMQRIAGYSATPLAAVQRQILPPPAPQPIHEAQAGTRPAPTPASRAGRGPRTAHRPRC